MTTTFTQQVLNGRYRVGPLLESGVAADVYQGFDRWLSRSVAIKIFRSESDEETLLRFALEARALARLNHPGVVTVFDTGMTEQRPYLVMQLLRGPTLGERISQGTMSPTQVARLGEQLAEILSHAHSLGVVHHDVTPATIRLDAEEQPHLSEFGVCRISDAPEFTDLDPLIGTPAYLSPEQLHGYPASPAADVYSLGLVLVECLTGYRDYRGGVMQAVQERRRRAPRIPTDLPPALSQVLQAMVVDAPEHRPDAAICAHRLRLSATACEQNTVTPRRRRAPRHLAVSPRRLRAPLTVVLGSAAAILTLAAPTGLSPSSPPPVAQKVPATPPVPSPPSTGGGGPSTTENQQHPLVLVGMPIPQPRPVAPPAQSPPQHQPSPTPTQPSAVPTTKQHPPTPVHGHPHKPGPHKK